jgi:hypothetical protein
MPTLFLCGRHDEARPEETSWYHSLVPRCRASRLRAQEPHAAPGGTPAIPAGVAHLPAPRRTNIQAIAISFEGRDRPAVMSETPTDGVRRSTASFAVAEIGVVGRGSFGQGRPHFRRGRSALGDGLRELVCRRPQLRPVLDRASGAVVPARRFPGRVPEWERSQAAWRYPCTSPPRTPTRSIRPICATLAGVDSTCAAGTPTVDTAVRPGRHRPPPDGNAERLHTIGPNATVKIK